MSITYLTLVLLVKKANGRHTVPIFHLPACTGKPRSAQMVPPHKKPVPWPQIEPFWVGFLMDGLLGCPGMDPNKNTGLGALFGDFFFDFFPTFLHSKGLSIELLFIYVYTDLIYVEWCLQCRGAPWQWAQQMGKSVPTVAAYPVIVFVVCDYFT